VEKHCFRTRVKRLLLVSTIAVGASLVLPLAEGVASASCTPVSGSTVCATAAISTGTLTIATPAGINFSDTLSGVDQTTTAGLAVDVRDATGSGAGWDLTATSSQFTNGGNTLATNSVTVLSSPTDACDAITTCSLAANLISYPYSLPAGAGPPAASKFFNNNSAANTGMGDQTVTPTFTLAIPANTLNGSYTSTWTISVAAGP
jgi:hypothetical protein